MSQTNATYRIRQEWDDIERDYTYWVDHMTCLGWEPCNDMRLWTVEDAYEFLYKLVHGPRLFDRYGKEIEP